MKPTPLGDKYNETAIITYGYMQLLKVFFNIAIRISFC